MHDTFALLHQLYKAKYFSHNNFLDSNMGHNTLYAWRGITIVKPWLLNGCRWRILDDRGVSIWHDLWILNIQSLNQLSSEDHSTRALTTISELIDQQTMWWDVAKINALFDSCIAKEILKVILLPVGQWDK